MKENLLRFRKTKLFGVRFFLMRFPFIIVLLCLSCLGCNDEQTNNSRTFRFQFDRDAEGWTGDFADYPNEQNVETFYEFEFGHSPLPEPLNTTDGALRQSGTNRSDDLFMFIKRKATGLRANAIYRIDFEIEIATNAASGQVGVGGAPGESVFIKAGASTEEPTKFLNTSENYFRMNIDKGNQSNDGEDMKNIGDFANGTTQNLYVLKTLQTPSSLEVRTNAQGELWLIIGTDSGFESTTTIFYNSVRVSLTPM